MIAGLALVSVTAQQGDNAHRIFESLNNTGLRLTQGDLLRNYLFMRLPTRGETVYQSVWLPLQQTLSAEQLELLFWLDLVQRDARIKQSEIYAGQQAGWTGSRQSRRSRRRSRASPDLGTLLATILDPTREADRQVRRRLQRLNSWGTTTVYPLLLHLFERGPAGTATSEQIASAMLYVESFLVRRLLIGRATANINRILLSVVTEMDENRSGRPGDPRLPVHRPQVLRLRRGNPRRSSDRCPTTSTGGRISGRSCCSGWRSPTAARSRSTRRD